MTVKNTINLLQPELLPKKAFWTLAKVVSIWGLSLGAMLLWLFINQTQINRITVKHSQVQSENASLQSRQTQLEQQVANRKPDAELVNKLSTLKFVLANKEALHQQLTDSTNATVAGFASAMTELAQLHHKDISLSEVVIANDHMTFKGVARSPEVVPLWLDGFEESVLLSGKGFVNFTLTENEQKLTDFVVSSLADTGAQ